MHRPVASVQLLPHAGRDTGMKRLVYGIGLASGDWQRPLPLGPQASAVDLVCEGELAAAFSGVVDSSVSPATPFLVAYAQVIAQLHRRGAILPMRYGCLLEGDASIRDLLRARRSEFLKALAEVDGCDEFGLRVLFDEKAPDTDERRIRLRGRFPHFHRAAARVRPTLPSGTNATPKRICDGIMPLMRPNDVAPRLRSCSCAASTIRTRTPPRWPRCIFSCDVRTTVASRRPFASCSKPVATGF